MQGRVPCAPLFFHAAVCSAGAGAAGAAGAAFCTGGMTCVGCWAGCAAGAGGCTAWAAGSAVLRFGIEIVRVSSAAAGVWLLRAAGVGWGAADGVTAGLLPYSRSR